MPKGAPEKEAGVDKNTEIEIKYIILEAKKLDVLDKVALNLEEYVISDLLGDEENPDEADGFGSKIKEIIDHIYEEFRESFEDDEENGKFVKALIKIFTILLSTKCSSIIKIKKIIRMSRNIALQVWSEPKP